MSLWLIMGRLLGSFFQGLYKEIAATKGGKERPKNLTRRCGATEDVREVLKISLRSLQLKKSSADFSPRSRKIIGYVNLL